MQIILKEKTELKAYSFNFEELKTELSLNLEKYRNLVVSEDAIKEAKTTRADLNKLKKEIQDNVKEVKIEHLKPFEAFREQTDQLIRLIDEPVYLIDSQVKSFEEKQKDLKLAEIMKIWEKEKPSSVEISFDQVFKNQWLNATVTLSKIRAEIIDIAIKVVKDIQVIESFNSKYEVPIKEIYFKNFDMSAAMAEKARYEQREIEEAERQVRLKAEIEHKEAVKEQQRTIETPEAEFMRVTIKFELTDFQANKLFQYFVNNGIAYEVVEEPAKIINEDELVEF